MRFILSYSWAFLWSICMLYLMLKSPSNDIPIPLYEGFDKIAHCGSFFLLTALFLYGAVANTKGMARKYLTAFWVLLGTGSFAFFSEFAQYYFTSTRQADWWDIFADAVGIGMALFSYLLFYRKRF